MNTTTQTPTKKNILAYINQARYIMTNYRKMADKLRAEISAIRSKKRSNDTPAYRGKLRECPTFGFKFY